MKTATKLSAAVLLGVVGLWSLNALPSINTGSGDDTDERRTIELIAKSSEPVIFVDATVYSSRDGIVIQETQARKNEPWRVELVADRDERVEIELTVRALGEPVAEYKVFSRCEIWVNGRQVVMDRDELIVRRPEERSTRADCEYSG